MRALLTALFVTAAVPALAQEDCRTYRSPLYEDDRIVWMDDMRFMWIQIGGGLLECEQVENRRPRGPFPAVCDKDRQPFDVEYSFFPGPTGEIGQTMLIGGEVYYRRCDL